jgi:hypothetical protein
MAENDCYRREEAGFLDDMAGVLGAKAIAALHGIAKALALDYAGVDFGLDRDGNLLLFEANATMVVARPGNEDHWAYRRSAIDRAIDAAVNMIRRRAAKPS